MAGGAVGPGNDPDRVLITIDSHLDNVQKMTAAFAFLPQFAATARMEMHGSRRSRCRQRFGIHKTNHQDGSVSRIRDNGAQQPVAIIFGVQLKAGFARPIHRLLLADWSVRGNGREFVTKRQQGADKLAPLAYRRSHQAQADSGYDGIADHQPI
jgi:hypothetical protein